MKLPLLYDDVQLESDSGMMRLADRNSKGMMLYNYTGTEYMLRY